jgi:hypothetical protein
LTVKSATGFRQTVIPARGQHSNSNDVLMEHSGQPMLPPFRQHEVFTYIGLHRSGLRLGSASFKLDSGFL